MTEHVTPEMRESNLEAAAYHEARMFAYAASIATELIGDSLLTASTIHQPTTFKEVALGGLVVATALTGRKLHQAYRDWRDLPVL